MRKSRIERRGLHELYLIYLGLEMGIRYEYNELNSATRRNCYQTLFFVAFQLLWCLLFFVAPPYV